jgi:pyruvate ferredoxin oxidoreductase gamma subunit
MTFEVRIHGRGGQGVVTAAELLAHAAFAEGRHAQAFPSFGSERTGAPVVAFCRISEVPIRLHEPVAAPDALVIQDPTLLHQVDVFGGLRSGGYVLINTERSLEELGLGELAERVQPDRVLTLPATQIARRALGRPLPGAPLLGGLAALTGIVSLPSVTEAVRERFPGRVGAANAEAAAEAYEAVKGSREVAHA